MDLYSVEVEPHPRHCYVQPPHARATLAHLGNCRLPVALEVRAPLAQRHRVMLAQVLRVSDLKPVIVHRTDDRADALKLAIREDVAIDEGAGTVSLAVGR